MSEPIHMLCLYRLKPENEAAFRALLAKHWDTLAANGLVTEDRARIEKSTHSNQHEGLITFVERFSWKDKQAVGVAHESPAVMQVWEPMGALCAHMEFIEVAPCEL